MTPTGPLVSVLTPSYNQGRWLPANLHSVACQTYPHIEHIVMDGGSTDESVDILRAAGEKVTWRSEPDEGQSDAVNKAFDVSRGEVIGWINSDDAYFDCHVVEDVVAYFGARPEVSVVYGHTAQITSDGRISEILWKPAYSKRRLMIFNYVGQPAVFIRRSALNGRMLDRGFHFAMDYELWLRLARDHRFGRIDRITAVDRQQPERKTDTMMDVFHADVARLQATYGQRYPRYWQAYLSAFLVVRRFAGARLIRRIPTDLAFLPPQDATVGLWKRQVLTRRQHWPAEFR